MFLYSILPTRNFLIIALMFILNSCSTLNSTWDSISEAGDYVYDTVVFWEDDEPEQEQAIVIEEAVEVPEFVMPNQPLIGQTTENQEMIQPPNYGYQAPYFDPVYRSARQYFYVTPNGTPMPAPPPPPFPQYSIESESRQNQFYGSNFDFSTGSRFYSPRIPNNSENSQLNTEFLSEEEQMEIYGIQNNCIRVEVDYMNGGFRCDDTE